MADNNFVDAKKQHERHPETFQIPSEKRLAEIKKGDLVKICHNLERFWVQVLNINKKIITGRVDNDLINSHPFTCDDVVKFNKNNIMNIWMED